VTDVWLAGAILVFLLAAVRGSLLTEWWKIAIPAGLAGGWVYLTFDEISRKSLAQIYAPLAQPDLLALLLMIPLVESMIGLRAAARRVDTTRPLARWQDLLAVLPNLSLLLAMRLLTAQAFQAAPGMFDFDTFGLLLSLSVTASLLVIPLLLQWLLPNLLWRLELYVILRGMFLLAIFVGYGLITWQPVSSPRADLSWRGTGIVCGGMLGLVLLGAWLSRWSKRLSQRLRFTTDLHRMERE